jgi:hypothetical protein
MGDARKIKNIIFSLFMLFMLSFCYNKPANGHIYIGNINELKEKNYMTDIEFIIEYDPSINKNIIYKYSLVSVEIISLYADGVMINGNEDEIQFDGVRISLTEYDENKITRKRRVAPYDSRYGWLLFFIPRGEILKLRAYHIPWMTKKLKIVYRIMFPGGGSSEQKESVLLIR